MLITLETLLLDVWHELESRPEGFICTTAAHECRERLGEGVIFGYVHDENPEAELGESEGGHDFLLVRDRYIVDYWAHSYYQHRPIWDMQNSDGAVWVKRLYGAREKWVDISMKGNFENVLIF